MDTEPIAVALKFGFLAVLYLFLLWVARSAYRELRRTTVPAPEATGIHSTVGPGGRSAATDAWLVAVTRGGLGPRERFGLFGGVFTRGDLSPPASASTCSAGYPSGDPLTPMCASRTASRRGSTRACIPAEPTTTLRT